MRDLLIITPTRERPGNAVRLAEAVAATCTARTDLLFAMDSDDRSCDGTDLGGAMVALGPRMTCPDWSNKLAAEHAGNYKAIASLGDDHLPRTKGWDTVLLAAIDAMGGTGIAYGNDIGQGRNLPTAPVMSSDIPLALGWWFMPGARHLFCDNAWKDLGEAAGCIRYVPGVVIEHLHVSRGAAPADDVYTAAHACWADDQAAYEEWKRDRLPADAAKVRRLREHRPGGWAGAPR